MRFKIVDKYKYELLEKMSQRIDNYIEEIKLLGKRLEENNDKQASIIKEIDEIKKEIVNKESQRKKLASKVGGLKKSLNKQKENNKLLTNVNEELALLNIAKDTKIRELRERLKKVTKDNKTIRRDKNERST